MPLIAAALLGWLAAFPAASARAEPALGDVGWILSEARLSAAPGAPAAAPAGMPAGLVPGFCAAPDAFVCGSGTGEDERQRALAAEQGSFRRRALESTLAYVGVDPSRRPEFSEESDLAEKLPPADRLKAARFYYKTLRESLRAYLAENGLPADYGMTRLKADMKEAVAESTDFAPEARRKMAAIIDETRMITIADDASDVELRAGDLSTVWLNCGKEQLVSNAFSLRKRGERLIVICPGYLIGTIQYAKRVGLPHELLLSAMTNALAHEIGHQFDGEKEGFKRAYGSTLSLLRQNRSGLDPQLPPEEYMSEATADLWGARTLAVSLRAIADPAVRAKVLIENFADLCGYPDDGFHPSTAFRLDVLAPPALCR